MISAPRTVNLHVVNAARHHDSLLGVTLLTIKRYTISCDITEPHLMLAGVVSLIQDHAFGFRVGIGSRLNNSRWRFEMIESLAESTTDLR